MSGPEKTMTGDDAAGAETTSEREPEQGFVSLLVSEVTSSPLNMLLVTLIVVLVYKIFKPRDRTPVAEPVVSLPPIRKDMTVAQLREYDGSREDGRLLIAVNGIVFDVTAGRRFYGPGTTPPKPRKSKFTVIAIATPPYLCLLLTNFPKRDDAGFVAYRFIESFCVLRRSESTVGDIF